MKITDVIFNEKEQKVINLINQGKSFNEIEEIVKKDGIENVKYFFKAKICSKIENTTEIKKLKNKYIIELKKFKDQAYFIGRALSVIYNKSFLKNKMVVIDYRLKTANKVNLNPSIIKNGMDKNAEGKELPTHITKISNRVKIDEKELIKIIRILFADKIFLDNNIVISTSKRLSSFVPNYFFIKDDGKKSLKQIFDELKNNKSFKIITKRKIFDSLDSFFYYIKMQNKYFALMPFIPYKIGEYELKNYFYKTIVPSNIDKEKIIEEAINFIKNNNLDFFCIEDFIEYSNQKLEDKDIIRTILIDSGYFKGKLGKIYCLSKKKNVF